MKIEELYTGLHVMLTNEEKKFLTLYGNEVSLLSLNERDEWVAQSLIKKGVYDISADRKFLTRPSNATK